MRTARPEPDGFAAKAKDLQALRDAVDQAAAVSGALWLSYIFVFLYLAIAAGAVTHKDCFSRTRSSCRSSMSNCR